MRSEPRTLSLMDVWTESQRRVKDSAPFGQIKQMVDERLRFRFIPEPKRRMGLRWRTKVGGLCYSEMWLRHYAQLRQMHGCIVMASDWANRMTGENKPINRDNDHDLELLLAHARLLQKTGETVVREGGKCVTHP